MQKGTRVRRDPPAMSGEQLLRTMPANARLPLRAANGDGGAALYAAAFMAPAASPVGPKLQRMQQQLDKMKRMQQEMQAKHEQQQQQQVWRERCKQNQQPFQFSLFFFSFLSSRLRARRQ